MAKNMSNHLALFFQYCGSHPRMQVCQKDEVAYTAAYIFDPTELIQAHNLHCYCPPSRMHVRDKVNENIIDGNMILATDFTCSAVSSYLQTVRIYVLVSLDYSHLCTKVCFI